MRALLITGVAVSFVAVAAQAQTSSTTTPAPADASAASTTVAAPGAPSAGTTSASLTENVTAVKPRRLLGEFVSENTLGVQDYKNSEGNIESSNYVGLKYKAMDNLSVSVRQPFTYTLPAVGDEQQPGERKGSAHVSDFYVSATRANLLKWGQGTNEGSVTGVGRLYFPTGETSRYVTKTHGSALAWFIADQPLTKDVTLSLHSISRVYNQSKNTYLNKSGKETGNKDFDQTVFASAGWEFSKYVSFSQSIGNDVTRYRSNPTVPGKKIDNLWVSSGLTFSGLIPKVTILTSITQDFEMGRTRAEKRGFQLYRDSESTYSLLLIASI